MEEEVPREEFNIEGVSLSMDYLRCMEFVNKSEGSKVVLLETKDAQKSNCTLPTILKFTVSKTTEDFYYTRADPDRPWGEEENNIYVFNNIENPKPFIRLYQKPVPENQISSENVQSLLEKEA